MLKPNPQAGAGKRSRLARWLRFRYTVRVPLVIATIIALTVGPWCAAARRQIAAVDAIRRAGGEPWYAGRANPWGVTRAVPALAPAWVNYLERHYGIDYAQPVAGVKTGRNSAGLNVSEAVPALAALPKLRSINLGAQRISGAELEQLACVRSLELLVVNCDSPRGLEPFAGHPHLKRLNLIGNFDDSSIADLAPILHLRHLGLFGTKVTSAGFATLGDLSPLESLTLLQPRVTAADLSHFQRLPRLRSLSVCLARIDEASVAALAELGQLEELDLSQSYFEAESLAPLARLQNVRTLRLSFSTLDDSLARALPSLPALAELDISGTQVTDAGLVALAIAPRLKVVQLNNTRITQRGAKRLQSLCPNLEIRECSPAE